VDADPSTSRVRILAGSGRQLQTITPAPH